MSHDRPLRLVVTGWLTYILGFSKIRKSDLTLLVFPDGRVRVISTNDVLIEGVIDGQQWCTRLFTVLSFVTKSKRHRLLIWSGQQNAGDYRQLNVWLAHNKFAIK